jgi:hypothetical protein
MMVFLIFGTPRRRSTEVLLLQMTKRSWKIWYIHDRRAKVSVCFKSTIYYLSKHYDQWDMFKKNLYDKKIMIGSRHILFTRRMYVYLRQVYSSLDPILRNDKRLGIMYLRNRMYWSIEKHEELLINDWLYGADFCFIMRMQIYFLVAKDCWVHDVTSAEKNSAYP